MIDNTDKYVELMRTRAVGSLPDMGSALRLADLLRQDVSTTRKNIGRVELLDIGCAAGHYLRTFMRTGLRLDSYCGVEIDPAMVAVAREVWRDEIRIGSVEFVNVDVRDFSPRKKFDFVVCMNAFMYFTSPKLALEKMIAMTKRRLLIRSYFSDSNYRIIRPQTKANHDKSEIEESAAFDDNGNIPKFDLWNIYSFEYIEALILRLSPHSRVKWLDDDNPVESINKEATLNLEKRGATKIIFGHEVSYPFILPWKYLSIRVGL